jgi:hypothetical protein
MNKKKNTDIISILQNRYRRELTISVSAPIEDVCKTFEALSKTGAYIQYSTFYLHYWKFVTKATLEQRLDGNGTTINLSVQVSKEACVSLITQILSSFVAFIYMHIYMSVSLWGIAILYTVFGFLLYLSIPGSFDRSIELLVDRLQEEQVWNGLGSRKPTMKDLFRSLW